MSAKKLPYKFTAKRYFNVNCSANLNVSLKEKNLPYKFTSKKYFNVNCNANLMSVEKTAL